jgi:predicted RNA binding protein YcfA (HicA-like mRNA interferase family)
VPGRLRSLSGAEVVRIFGRFGFYAVKQAGSHVKLRRIAEHGERQTLNIPLHPELKPGTLRAIFRQASDYVPPDDLRPHFFSD